MNKNLNTDLNLKKVSRRKASCTIFTPVDSIVLMLGLHVALEVPARRETFAAISTLVGFLASVRLFVLVKMS